MFWHHGSFLAAAVFPNPNIYLVCALCVCTVYTKRELENRLLCKLFGKRVSIYLVSSSRWGHISPLICGKHESRAVGLSNHMAVKGESIYLQTDSYPRFSSSLSACVVVCLNKKYPHHAACKVQSSRFIFQWWVIFLNKESKMHSFCKYYLLHVNCKSHDYMIFRVQTIKKRCINECNKLSALCSWITRVFFNLTNECCFDCTVAAA